MNGHTKDIPGKSLKYRMHPEKFLGNKLYSMKLRYVFQFFYRQNISKKPRSTVAGNDKIPKIV